jgi:hypothetical protein
MRGEPTGRLVRSRTVICSSTLALVLMAALAGDAPAPPEAADRLPYRIAAQVAISAEARIDARGRDRLIVEWRGLVHRFIGAPWELTVAEGDRAALGVDLDALEPAALAAIAHDHDKVWLIQLGRERADWTLAGRELDTATMRLGPTHRRLGRFAADLPRALLALALDLFRPLAAIGEPSGGGVTLTVRGASLRAASPLGHFVKAGTVFRPIRKVALPDGVERVLDIPFSYLPVESLEGPLVRCTIISALRDPLTRRIAQKSTLVALGSAPGPNPTRLRFVTAPDKAPAAGYLLTGRLVPDGQPRELGTTDREGRIVLPAGSYQGLLELRLVAGSVEPIVEFPLMPGESAQERTIPPFDPRNRTVALETELDSLRDSVIDLVATRARIEARLKARLDGEDWPGLEAGLLEFSRLPARETFAGRLSKLKEDALQEQARTKTAILTKTAQAQIAELDGLIARYLDDDAFRAYSDALARARSDAARAKATKAKKR